MKRLIALFLALSTLVGIVYGKKGPKIIYPSKTTVSVLDPDFSWNYSDAPGIIFEIKIAEDPEFTKNVINLRTPNHFLKLSLPYLKPGAAYYWTIRALQHENSDIVSTDWAHQDKKDMQEFMFSVSDQATGDVGYAPVIKQPENGVKINTIKPVFRWTYNNHQNTNFTILNRNNEWVSPQVFNVTYRLQISRSREFSDNFKTFEIKNDSTSLALTIPYILQGQTYYWRLKAVYSDPEKLDMRESDWSVSSVDSKIPASFSTDPGAAGTFGFNEGQKEEIVDPFKIASVERVTTGQGNYFAPAISMDGTKLAYCSDRDNQTEIYFKNLDEKFGGGETKKTVSTKGVSNYNPFWLFNNEEVGFYSNRYNQETIWELFSTTRGTGTSVTYQTNRLEMEESPVLFNLYGSCSGDGKIVFSAKSRNNPLTRILLKDLTDNSITDLRPGMFPFISNDDRIVFAADEKQDGNYEIMMVELEGHSLNNPVVMTSHESADFDPSISPDGTRIVFTSNRSGNSDIWIMDIMGTNLRQLSFHPMADRRAQWIDNENIVFQSNRIVNNDNKPTWNIYKMKVPKN